MKKVKFVKLFPSFKFHLLGYVDMAYNKTKTQKRVFKITAFTKDLETLFSCKHLATTNYELKCDLGIKSGFIFFCIFFSFLSTLVPEYRRVYVVVYM